MNEKKNEEKETLPVEELSTPEIVRQCASAGMSKEAIRNTIQAYKGFYVAKQVYEILKIEFPDEITEAYQRGRADRDIRIADCIERNLTKGTKQAISDFLAFDRHQRYREALAEYRKL